MQLSSRERMQPRNKVGMGGWGTRPEGKGGPGAHRIGATLERWLMLGLAQVGKTKVYGAGPT